MENAIKNCVDDKFTQSNLNTLLWRISFGFDDSSNIIFFNCSKEELFNKKKQLINEFIKENIHKSYICSQFHITNEQLNDIIQNNQNNQNNNTTHNLNYQINLLTEKELFLNLKLSCIDEKLKLLDEKIDIIDDKLKNNEIKSCIFENKKKKIN